MLCRLLTLLGRGGGRRLYLWWSILPSLVPKMSYTSSALVLLVLESGWLLNAGLFWMVMATLSGSLWDVILREAYQIKKWGKLQSGKEFQVCPS